MNTLKINISDKDWLYNATQFALTNHLICVGTRNNLQWFGTNLIQELAKQPDTETSTIYGKLATNIDNFCYQLCHSTPWGFDMGRNLNAIVDVLRGENNIQNKFHIIYDGQFLYKQNFEMLKQLIEKFLQVGEESEYRNKNQKVILLLEGSEQISPRKLLRHKEKYPTTVVQVIQGENE